jgi:hypothetical protein
MDGVWRTAFCVVFGQFEGQEFDWKALRWLEKDTP